MFYFCSTVQSTCLQLPAARVTLPTTWAYWWRHLAFITALEGAYPKGFHIGGPAGAPVRLSKSRHSVFFLSDSFTRQVLWKLLKVVKFGEMVSYQQLAALAGNPKAARAVGGAMRNNPVPILIPCHRVICSDGSIGNYSGGGQAVKEWLLSHEGIPIQQPSCKDLGLTGTRLKPSRVSTSSKPSG
ncbi:Mgmt [Phodopus roborovskii]|uniref:Methylated-DNA--protein-cysteine methyltransferase n=1 Tax=Phodopus roborovskii TaxID=109678 RepID=A0AAU9ZM45_PHORO|nr:Mgmt [Phodopus roborovskii]